MPSWAEDAFRMYGPWCCLAVFLIINLQKDKAAAVARATIAEDRYPALLERTLTAIEEANKHNAELAKAIDRLASQINLGGRNHV